MTSLIKRKVLAPIFFASILINCGVAYSQGDPAVVPTAIKLIDGSVTLIGMGLDGKTIILKLGYDQINKKPIPGEPSLLRKEIDLSKYNGATQSRLTEVINDFGYFAVGLDAKNSKLKQKYHVFDSRDNKIGEAGSFAVEK